MKYKLIEEKFNTLDELLKTLEGRKNNEVMKQCKDSIRGEKWFTGTSSYSEAERLCRFGYKDYLSRVKEESARQIKENYKLFANVEKNIPKNKVVGYIPNVPNALQNLPDSMIMTDRKPIKKKTITIIYSPCGLGDREVEWYIRAGIAMTVVTNILERKGMRIRLYCAFKTSESGKEATMASVLIKNFDEKYNLEKICFPFINPSMQRRIGFKWLETHPDIKDRGWKCGYGKTFRDDFVKENLNLGPNTKYISAYKINDLCCNIEEIIKYLEIDGGK